MTNSPSPTPMPAAELLGVELVEDNADRVVFELVIGDHHLNQALVTHGRVLFTLADTALGLLANPPGLDRPWVGTSFGFQLYRGTAVGDRVRATARYEHHSRRLRVARVALERRGSDDVDTLLGVLTAQLLIGPAATAPGADAPEPTMCPTASGAPLARALLAAQLREHPHPEDCSDGKVMGEAQVLGVFYRGDQPCGYATLTEDGRPHRTWTHPSWRDGPTRS